MIEKIAPQVLGKDTGVGSWEAEAARYDTIGGISLGHIIPEVKKEAADVVVDDKPEQLLGFWDPANWPDHDAHDVGGYSNYALSPVHRREALPISASSQAAP